METKPSPPLRLTSPYSGDPSFTVVNARISKSVNDYFFTHILAGPRGPTNALIGIFFDKLYHYCVDVENIPSVYDPDGVHKIATILSRLNFNEPRPEPARRADPRPAKPKKQPASSNSNAGGTPPRGKKGQNSRRETAEIRPNHVS